MAITRHLGVGSSSGSGSGEVGQDGPVLPEVIGQISTDELDARIREILHDEMAAMFRAQLPKMFGSIKTAMVEYFDEPYAALAESATAAVIAVIAAAGGGVSRGFQYRDFDKRSHLPLMEFRI